MVEEAEGRGGGSIVWPVKGWGSGCMQMCCWQRTSALPLWALSQQAVELKSGSLPAEKGPFVCDMRAMACASLQRRMFAFET